MDKSLDHLDCSSSACVHQSQAGSLECHSLSKCPSAARCHIHLSIHHHRTQCARLAPEHVGTACPNVARANWSGTRRGRGIRLDRIGSDQISAALTFVPVTTKRRRLFWLMKSPGQHGRQPLFSFVRPATTRRDKGEDRAWVASARGCPSKRHAALCMHAECASPPRHLWKQAASCSAELPIGAWPQRMRIIPGV